MTAFGKCNVVEDDGVVIFEETDDQFDDTVELDNDQEVLPSHHDPNIVEDMYLGGIVKDKDGYRLKENEEVFTDEYMRQYDRYITEKTKKEKRQNLLVSIGVIMVCILIIIVITVFAFWLRT